MVCRLTSASPSASGDFLSPHFLSSRAERCSPDVEAHKYCEHIPSHIIPHKSICGPHIDMHIAHAATRVMTGHDGSGLTSQVSRVAMVSIKNLHFPWNRCLSLKCCTVSLSA